MAAGRNFTVNLTARDGLREVTGKVLSVDVVENAKPGTMGNSRGGDDIVQDRRRYVLGDSVLLYVLT